MGQVVSRQALVEIRKRLKQEGKRVVFTNGCFDLIHRGHIEYLTKAKALGSVLAVGINSDRSVRQLKGEGRPIVEEQDRAIIVAALMPVDYVCIFDEETPLELIRILVPDILVKGADWPIDAVVGKDIVEKSGGSVQTIQFIPDRSTTLLVEKISKLGSRKG